MENKCIHLMMLIGCFLVAVPDSCYDSSHDSLSYCWCSHADLCNSGPSLRPSAFQIYSLSVALSTYLLMWYWYIYTINISNMRYSQLSSTVLQCTLCPLRCPSSSWSVLTSRSRHDDRNWNWLEKGEKKSNMATFSQQHMETVGVPEVRRMKN